jgi:hypothetical protein
LRGKVFVGGKVKADGSKTATMSGFFVAVKDELPVCRRQQ